MQVPQVFLWSCCLRLQLHWMHVLMTVHLLRHPEWKEDVVTLQKNKKQNKTCVSGYSRYGMLLQCLNGSSV